MFFQIHTEHLIELVVMFRARQYDLSARKAINDIKCLDPAELFDFCLFSAIYSQEFKIQLTYLFFVVVLARFHPKLQTFI
jgi:hypothetical protein